MAYFSALKVHTHSDPASPLLGIVPTDGFTYIPKLCTEPINTGSFWGEVRKERIGAVFHCLPSHRRPDVFYSVYVLL